MATLIEPQPFLIWVKSVSYILGPTHFSMSQVSNNQTDLEMGGGSIQTVTGILTADRPYFRKFANV